VLPKNTKKNKVVRMVKSTTGRRGRGHKGSTDQENGHGKAPWEWEDHDDDLRGDLRDLYAGTEEPGTDDYNWAAAEDEDDD
jgi:hypothetical protein